MSAAVQRSLHKHIHAACDLRKVEAEERAGMMEETDATRPRDEDQPEAA